MSRFERIRAHVESQAKVFEALRVGAAGDGDQNAYSYADGAEDAYHNVLRRLNEIEFEEEADV